MGYVRTLLCFLYLFLFFFFGLLVELAAFLVRLGSPPAAERITEAYVRFGLRSILVLAGCRVETEGLERVPTDRAVLYVGNHRSMFDIVAFGALPLPMPGFIAKIEWEKTPFLRTWMRYIHCLFLDREDIRQGMETILKATEELKAGHSLFVFPEGTRNKGSEVLLPFHTGSFKMATKAGAPIVPVVICGTEDIFEPHFPRLDPHTVHIYFGEPIDTASVPRQEQKNIPGKVEAVIREAYLSHRT